MTALPNSLVLTRSSPIQLSPGSPFKPVDQFLGSGGSTNLSFNANNRLGKVQLLNSKRPLTVQAGYGEGGRPSSAGIFVGGFVLGGIIVGTLGAVYAPQISKALAGADRKDLMRKLPKFIYDEEKALEKTRKVLTEKIAQLNSAIDDVSAQLRSEDAPNGAAVNSDEMEATI
ncbi:uncharacterized protein LOC131162230 [Malania oleifera]|uniref:uncharacterized protein LOC131162230 n=1 Tax=Malania oleifera TaxID=397392 RepID=UPI0025AE8FF0|nr:uncharacterized protein LOC131162230 [Malania oleifera]